LAGIRTGIWGGWAYYDSGEPGEQIYVRFCEDERGRLFICDLRVARSDGISTVTLRGLALGQIEAQANSPENLPVLRAIIRAPRPDEVISDERFWAERAAAGPVPLEAPPELRRLFGLLDIPKSKKYPDDFYREVASIYSALAKQRRDPAQELATRNKVEATTVHRWLREARRRGFLAPGRVRTKSRES
jgi:hypothetical protein